MIFDVIFSDFFGWDWGPPAILRQDPNKITILYGCGFHLKSWDWFRPPPLVRRKSQLWPIFFLQASLKTPPQPSGL